MAKRRGRARLQIAGRRAATAPPQRRDGAGRPAALPPVDQAVAPPPAPPDAAPLRWRLGFLAELGNLEDGQVFTPAQWHRIVELVAYFLRVRPEHRATCSDLRHAIKDRHWLRPALSTVRDLVQAVAHRKRLQPRFMVERHTIEELAPGRVVRWGALRDLVILAAVDDLATPEAHENIRVCQKANCQRVFVGRKSAQFCSKRCTNAAAYVQRVASRR